MKTPLIWTGKKSWLANSIKPLWDIYKNTHAFVEPFGGSLSVSFELEAKSVLAADNCPGWYAFFVYVLQSGLDLEKLQLDLKNTKECYYQIRKAFNQNEGDAYLSRTGEHGLMFYYLNRMCFGGNMRVNSKNALNTPYGYRKEEFSIDPLKDQSLKDLIREWVFFDSWCEILKFATCPMFIFADPPYDESVDAYGRDHANKEKQIEWANELAKQNGPVIACNAPTEFIKDLYSFHKFDIFEGCRKSTGFHNDKRKREFIMFKNFTKEQLALLKLEKV